MFQTSGACGGQPRTAAEILLSALSQAKTLTSLVNRTLKLSEEEALAALDPAAAGQVAEQQRVVARGERLVEITMAINKQLTQLLAIIQENEREREALRRELARSQDQERVNTGVLNVDNKTLIDKCTIFRDDWFKRVLHRPITDS